jgi:hypothetical protein
VIAFAREFVAIDQQANQNIRDFNAWLPTVSGKQGSTVALEAGHHRSQQERVIQRLDTLDVPAEAAAIRDDYRAGMQAFLRAMDIYMENWRSGGAISGQGTGDSIRRANELIGRARAAFDALLRQYGLR